MQLDHVVHSLTTGEIVEEAMQRSIRWLDRCQKAQIRQNDQLLLPIIQGGLNLNLREICTKEMIKRATVGIAIGGKIRLYTRKMSKKIIVSFKVL